jgi:POT family proton-dependent oligopeptide transporter
VSITALSRLQLVTNLRAENYIQNRSDDPLRPGALGLGQDIASLMVNCFTLVSQVTPLATAAIADSYLGHYKTLRACFWLVSILARLLCNTLTYLPFVCSLYAVGLTILVITSLTPLLREGSGLPGLVVALIIISLGVGGVKSTLPPFLGQSNRYTRLSHYLVAAANLQQLLAEQCHACETRIRISKTGERVIVDREATVEYAFNVYYW